jgi:hypothetical protein
VRRLGRETQLENWVCLLKPHFITAEMTISGYFEDLFSLPKYILDCPALSHQGMISLMRNSLGRIHRFDDIVEPAFPLDQFLFSETLDFMGENQP